MFTNKGFTLVELVITMMIIGLLAVFAVFQFVPSAHGAELQIGKYMTADEDHIASVARALRADTSMNVYVMAYSGKWTMELVDQRMDEMKYVEKQLIKHGVSKSRIVLSIANKAGLDNPLAGHSDNIPQRNGTYLILE
jgi:prepilin-type N-terminal cleavage/methylation domain-containing protein